MAAVELQSLHKVFDAGTCAIDNLNLQVKTGELLVLVGPSGCGKSTLLRLIAGLEQPTDGKILINDQTVNDLPPQARNLAMVFQNYALYPHMTVTANLAFPLRMAGLGKADIEARVTEVASQLGLTPLLQRYPRQLSGGQRQRVAMGRALVRSPQLFLLDEPLSNLDARLRVQIRNEIANLQTTTGISTIYVTHDQVEAMSLGHRVAVMRAGRIEQIAPPTELYNHPQTAFVASFLGSPGMNLFSTKLEIDGDHAAFVIGGQRLKIPAVGENDVIVGIRPEAFHLDRSEGPDIEAEIFNVEELGNERLIYFKAGVKPLSAEQIMTGELATGSVDVPLVARLPAGSPLTNSRLSIDSAQIRLFDRAGNALD